MKIGIDRRGFLKRLGIVSGGIALLGSEGLKSLPQVLKIDEKQFIKVKINGVPYYMTLYG